MTEIQPNPHSDRSKAQTPAELPNDERALRKHRDKPDDPIQSPVDPERDYEAPPKP